MAMHGDYAWMEELKQAVKAEVVAQVEAGTILVNARPSQALSVALEGVAAKARRNALGLRALTEFITSQRLEGKRLEERIKSTGADGKTPDSKRGEKTLRMLRDMVRNQLSRNPLSPQQILVGMSKGTDDLSELFGHLTEAAASVAIQQDDFDTILGIAKKLDAVSRGLRDLLTSRLADEAAQGLPGSPTDGANGRGGSNFGRRGGGGNHDDDENDSLHEVYSLLSPDSYSGGSFSMDESRRVAEIDNLAAGLAGANLVGGGIGYGAGRSGESAAAAAAVAVKTEPEEAAKQGQAAQTKTKLEKDCNV